MPVKGRRVILIVVYDNPRAMTPVTVRVREIREQRGWSQAELAKRSGVSVVALNRLEKGRTKGVTFDTLDRLARALEVHAAVLIDQRQD